MCAMLANLIVQNANFKLQFIIAISASNINVKANTSYEGKMQLKFACKEMLLLVANLLQR